MEDLVRKVLQGSTEEYAKIISIYEKNIYTYLYRLCTNKEDAADLTQDTFIKAYNNLDKFNPAMDFRPWLYRIAHNNYINYIKSKKEFIDIDCEDVPDFNTPEHLTIEKDEIKFIEKLVESLPYMYRAVFVLRTIEDLSFREIGHILNISESSARMRYLRVRKKLCSILKGGDNNELQVY